MKNHRTKISDFKRVGIRFTDQKAFGEFCIALTENRTPFSHLGGQSVALSPWDFKNLSMPVVKLFSEFENKDIIKLYDAAQGGVRRVRTKEEKHEALREIAEKWKARADSYR